MGSYSTILALHSYVTESIARLWGHKPRACGHKVAVQLLHFRTNRRRAKRVYPCIGTIERSLSSLRTCFLSHDERRAPAAGGLIDDTAEEGEVSPRRKKLRRNQSD